MLLIDGVNIPDSIAGGSYTFVNVTENHSIEIRCKISDVGVAETHCNASLRVYSNPTSGQLKITNYELRESTTIEIYNVVGQKLLSIESLESTETTIDVQHLANGMYFLKVGNRVVRFLKE